MKKAAFIGVGNMGGALARAACRSIGPEQVVLFNRTPAKAEALGAELGCDVVGSAADAVWAAEYLFLEHPDLPEGDLTRMRASLVCEQSLYEVARELELGSYLKLGRGEEAGGGRERQSILADATEAVFAAVYLDGGIQPVRELIVRVLLSQAPAAEERRDYKTTLQEVVQRRSGQVLTYHMLSQSGPDHNKTFLFEVRLNDESVGCGEGHSKKEAEQAAARDALEKMG